MSALPKAVLIITFLFTTLAVTFAMGEKPPSFSAYVSGDGTISLPADFSTTWVHMGSWIVTSQAAAGMGTGRTDHGTGLHNVYTQPESLTAYRNNGTWPDGSLIVMEVRSITWDDLPTGHVILGGDPVKWFVMVKDDQGRFPGNPGLGDGWGWALFTPLSSKESASADYRNDCRGCHEVARATDRVFIQGYPGLRRP